MSQKVENFIQQMIQTYGKSTGFNKKPLNGVGINDAPYITQNQRLGFICPHYRAWSGMIYRGYSEILKARRPTYEKCSVKEDWRVFSKFLGWSLDNYVAGWEVDKDILLVGNKEYSESACCYVPIYINTLLKQKQRRGNSVLGVWKQKERISPYKVVCGGKFLGYFSTEQEAHKTWQWEKASQIEETLAKYAKEPLGFRTDVAEALLERAWKLRVDHANNIITEIY